MLLTVKEKKIDSPVQQRFQDKPLSCWLALKGSALKGESTARARTYRPALKTYAAAALSVSLLSSPGLADNWPAWRGAEGSGISRETNLPLHWSTNENVRWRVALPDRGNCIGEQRNKSRSQGTP